MYTAESVHLRTSGQFYHIFMFKRIFVIIGGSSLPGEVFSTDVQGKLNK